MGFDVRTGQEAVDVPHDSAEGEPGFETWQGDSAQYTGNAGVWGPFSADPAAWLRVSEHRVGDQRRLRRPPSRQQPVSPDSLVCLDIKTGKMIWYQQLVHHDIWDYDMPPHPILIDLNGRREAGAGGRAAHEAGVCAYVFDRTNGRPGVAMGRDAGSADRLSRRVDGADAAVPIEAAGVRSTGVTHDDLIDFTPELRAEAHQGARAIHALDRSTRRERSLLRARTRGRSCARPRWRRELARGRRGSGNRLRLRRLDNDAGTDWLVARTIRRLPTSTRTTRWVARCPRSRAAPDEAALRTHHRLQHEQGRDRVADPERRHAAGGQEQPGAQGSDHSEDRQPVTGRDCSSPRRCCSPVKAREGRRSSTPTTRRPAPRSGRRRLRVRSRVCR